MTRKRERKGSQSVEIRIEIDGLKVVAAPDEHSDNLDRLLKQHDAESFVFIPLARKSGRLKQLIDVPTNTTDRRSKLPEGDWHDGELRNQGDGNAVAGVLAFDIRRRKAREIAEKLGVKEFFWGTSGAPIEQHSVKVFENDDTHSWASVRSLAYKGLPDMLLSARSIEELPTAVRESQTTIQKFWQLVAVVLGIAISAGVLRAIAVSLLGADGLTGKLVGVLFYPFVIPAVLVGLYLRVLVRRGEDEGRDFTIAEAEQNWRKVAPHLLALWMLCWSAILLLTWVQSVPSTEISFLGRTDGVMTSFIVCVWMLLPIANSHNAETFFGPAFEAAITAAVSIFMIKMSLYVTNLITDVIWDVVFQLVPFEFPERLQQAINFLINVGAEVFFVAVMLGYAWARTRQQFMRL